MDDSQDSSMDVSLSPQRAAGTGPSYGAKYNEDYGSPQSPLSASVANANESWNEDEAGDLIMVGDGGSEEDKRWDAIVGVLERVLMDESFCTEQEDYCTSHCHHFEATEENKLVYMELHMQFKSMVEEKIESELKSSIEDFTMEEFNKLLEEWQLEICGDIWDMLMTISDFEEFKNLMLAYKVQMEAGGAGQNGSFSAAFEGVDGNLEGLAPLVTHIKS